MTEAPVGAGPVFRARIDRRDDGFHARWGIGDAADAQPAPEGAGSGRFARHEDACDWVHLSAGQAGVRTICWDADSCPAPGDGSGG
jgi:hypothetical protein